MCTPHNCQLTWVNRRSLVYDLHVKFKPQNIFNLSKGHVSRNNTLTVLFSPKKFFKFFYFNEDKKIESLRDYSLCQNEDLKIN